MSLWGVCVVAPMGVCFSLLFVSLCVFVCWWGNFLAAEVIFPADTLGTCLKGQFEGFKHASRVHFYPGESSYTQKCVCVCFCMLAAVLLICSHWQRFLHAAFMCVCVCVCLLVWMHVHSQHEVSHTTTVTVHSAVYVQRVCAAAARTSAGTECVCQCVLAERSRAEWRV